MGYGFNLVSCPNYLFETIAWTSITVMTGSYAGKFSCLRGSRGPRLNSAPAMIFLVVSTYQMAVWALKKHRNYKKEFGEKYPRGRKAMFPFIL